ncbi:MAG: S41 family peptidase [Candidatus Campbellbacteria bacterium]|nr:S41 family peptidase [Candidatus Campbellbacteria bacterium]
MHRLSEVLAVVAFIFTALILGISARAQLEEMNMKEKETETFQAVAEIITDNDDVCGLELEDLVSLIQTTELAERNFLYDIPGNSTSEHMWWNALVGLNLSLKHSFGDHELKRTVRFLREEVRPVNQKLESLIAYEKVNESRNAKDFFYFFSYLCREDLLNTADRPLREAISQALWSLHDRYTFYRTPVEVARSSDRAMASAEEWSGPGITIFREENVGPFTIIDVRENSPAEEAGLRYGDKLYAINGNPVGPKTLEEAIESLRGAHGTTVQMRVLRKDGDGADEIIELQRLSDLPRLVSSRRLTNATFYISLRSLSKERAHSELRDALEEIRDQCPLPNIVLDLTGNGGGLIDTAIDVASEFMPHDSTVLYTKDRYGVLEEHRTNIEEKERVNVGLLTVLINNQTASAAEILAAALQSEGATLVGQRTFGKGVGQRLLHLKNRGTSHVTSFELLTPSGENFHEVGIAPDIETERFQREEITRIAEGEGVPFSNPKIDVDTIGALQRACQAEGT